MKKENRLAVLIASLAILLSVFIVNENVIKEASPTRTEAIQFTETESEQTF